MIPRKTKSGMVKGKMEEERTDMKESRKQKVSGTWVGMDKSTTRDHRKTTD